VKLRIDATDEAEFIDALERYRAVLDPASEDWLVFPTRHHSSLADAAENGLEARGLCSRGTLRRSRQPTSPTESKTSSSDKIGWNERSVSSAGIQRRRARS